MGQKWGFAGELWGQGSASHFLSPKDPLFGGPAPHQHYIPATGLNNFQSVKLGIGGEYVIALFCTYLSSIAVF